MSAFQPLQPLRFDTAILPPAIQFATWTSALAGMRCVKREPGEGFTAQVVAWQCGPLLVCEQTLGAVEYHRDAAEIARDTRDTIALYFLIDGHVEDLLGMGADFGPGDIYFVDMARPLACRASRTHSISVAVPRAYIEAALAGAPLHRIVIADGMGAVLRAMLRGMMQGLPTMDEAAAHLAAPVLRDAIAAVVRSASARGEIDAGAPMRLRILQYIDQNLTDDLDSDQLARALGMSRSALYRAVGGGLAQLVQRRRLARAHAALRDPADPRTTATIARDCGFASPSHFSRLLVRTYGITPSDLRRGGADAVVTGEDVPAVFREWTRAQG